MIQRMGGVWLALLPLLAGLTGCAGRTDWRTASRESAGLSADPSQVREALVQVYAARAFRWRGWFAVHSWVALKERDATFFEVIDVVGFRGRRGQPVVGVREDQPDRRWYGAEPELLQEVRGEAAEQAIHDLRAAVADYPYQADYRVYPGPNSNSFISYLLRNVDALTVELPPHAIGKDWLHCGWPLAWSESGSGLQVSLLGLTGFTLGLAEGIEINLIGLTFGVDLLAPALKLPLIGRLGFSDRPL